MRIIVNTYVGTTYEIDDKDIPKDKFGNWSDDEIASHFEKHGREVRKSTGYCGYPGTPHEIIEWDREEKDDE